MQARPFFVLAIVVAIWLLLPPVLKSLLRTGFHELQAPAVQTSSIIRDVQDYWTFRSYSKDELIEGIRDLSRQQADYELRLQQAEGLEREIERLERLFDLPGHEEFRYEIARVARRDMGAWWQRMIIRKGRNQGIPAGAPVVYAGGVVGKVSEVYLNTAVVDLISSQSLRLSARIEGDERPISYQGGVTPPFEPARGIAEFVPLDTRAVADDPRRVVTSGLGGVFPAGLYIGEITTLEPSADGLFQTGRVRLDDRLHSLYEVAVLVPLETGGEDSP